MRTNDVDLTKYTEISDIETIQQHLYDLFYAFHKICEDNGLIYNMYGGTLLGAVRHGGIIPWDDDVDVSMPRKDYENFIEIVGQNYSENYIVFAYPQKNYTFPYAKFGTKNSLLLEALKNKYNEHTLYIDIFPIDGCSDDISERDKDFAKLKKLKHSRGVCVDAIPLLPTFGGKIKNVLRHIRSALFNIVGYRKFLEKEIAIAKKYDFESSEYVCCIASSWFEKGIIKREKYLDRKLYGFGDHEFWGISDYDEHLTNLYGDYMTPPPVSERISNHNYHLFIEKSSLEESNG